MVTIELNFLGLVCWTLLITLPSYAFTIILFIVTISDLVHKKKKKKKVRVEKMNE